MDYLLNAQKLTDLTEREQRELIFLITERMRKDSNFFNRTKKEVLTNPITKLDGTYALTLN